MRRYAGSATWEALLGKRYLENATPKALLKAFETALRNGDGSGVKEWRRCNVTLQRAVAGWECKNEAPRIRLDHVALALRLI
jgi:hypothetical protein